VKTRVTNHAVERGRERFGMKASTVARMAEIALGKGFDPSTATGHLGRYASRKLKPHPGAFLRIYAEVVFVFGAGNALITFWPLPKEHRAVVAKLRGVRKRVPTFTEPE
jgi:hypothetical protein